MDHLRLCETEIGRRRHGRGERLPRHCHCAPFAAVVLSGRYVEAGDRGRMRVGPGDVVLHGPYESHLDEVAGAGAEVLVLPWTLAGTPSALGRIADVDGVVRLAERDAFAAADLLAERLTFTPVGADDWPDRLALALGEDPALRLEAWAETAGLRSETLSRGFRRAYGVTPMAFRARARVLRSLGMIGAGEALSEVAAACGFADQAHLSRSFRALTGQAPGRWRRMVLEHAPARVG